MGYAVVKTWDILSLQNYEQILISYWNIGFGVCCIIASENMTDFKQNTDIWDTKHNYLCIKR